jgi:hypothetical protein
LTIRGHLTIDGYGSNDVVRPVHRPNVGLTERIQRFTESVRHVHSRTTIKDAMSTLVELQGFQTTFHPPAANLHDEAAWKAWAAKGRASGRNYAAAAVFAALTLVYIPFLISLAWRDQRQPDPISS